MADPRFAALSTDPRYRLPSRKEANTAVDPRFRRLYTDDDFHRKASVDRYGRKIKPQRDRKKTQQRIRPDEAGPKDSKAKGKKEAPSEVVGSSDESGGGENDDGQRIVSRDPAREGGFSESSSEEESSSDEQSDDEAELAEETAGHEQTEDVPLGDVSHRIAAVNLDWDHIRAKDILAVAASFAPNNGRVERVTVYPSEFGRERLEREELEGPPREIFASFKQIAKGRTDENGGVSEEEDVDEDEKITRQLQQDQLNEGEEFDSAKLRQYQIERLRYYYAVISCDSKTTAKALYDSMDGREYLSTANFFDLRFIPDETSFDNDAPRDECTKLPEGYRPNEFRTEALTHSNVRLTWDDDDTTRKEVQKRAFSRAEMDENDLQAYIGSESSDAESVVSRRSAAEDRKANKKEAQRVKMRTALGLSDESVRTSKTKNEAVGDMQITFTPGLSGTGKGEGNSVFENEPQDEESTRDRYIRKERERKQKRKEKTKVSRSGTVPDGEVPLEAGAGGVEDPGFEDSFFTNPSAAAAEKKKMQKAARKEAASASADEGAALRRAELDLLMADDAEDDDTRHFDMRAIEKEEKAARRHAKGRGRKRLKLAVGSDATAAPDSFRVQTTDPRFRALFESHEFAIDPTNPRFKGTEGMKALLEEGRKRKRRDHAALKG